MGRWLTSLLLLVLLALAVPATARSAYPGANGRIAVVRYGGGLFTTDATGHDAKVLTYGATDFGPVYAPHGHRIAFERADDIWVVPARGGDPVRLTTASSWEGQPTWSPDGSRIAFVSNRGGAWRIYTLRSTRPYGKAVPVAAADDACTEEQPTWGVNGLIAFVRIACYSGSGAGDWSIAAVVPGESRIRTLVPACGGVCQSPDWGPAGHGLLYVAATIDSRDQLTGFAVYRFRLSDGRLTVVARSSNDSPLENPTWSPDGRRILYTLWSFRLQRDLWMARRDGSDARVVIRVAGDASWQPRKPFRYS